MRKGHFDDDVQVRCMTPWMPAGMVAAVMGLHEPSEAGAAGRRSSSGTCAADAVSSPMHRAGSVPAAALHEQPPPPPPRTSSIGSSSSGQALAPQLQALSVSGATGAAARAPGSPLAAAAGAAAAAAGAAQPLQEELAVAVFFGGCEPGKEPIWRFIDEAGAIQGPLTGRQMGDALAAGRIGGDTLVCGADRALDAVGRGSKGRDRGSKGLTPARRFDTALW